MTPFRLDTFSIYSLGYVETEANGLYAIAHRLYDASLLTRCYTQHALCHILPLKLIILGILSKLNLSTKGLNSETFPTYLLYLYLFWNKESPI